MTRRARGTGELRQVGDVWKVRYSLNGRRVQESAGPDKQDAVDLLNKRLGAAAEGRLNPAGVSMEWKDLEAIILDEHRQHRSYGKVERHVRRHLKRHFGGLKVQALTYDRLLRFKQERLAEKASPSTVRYELSLVHTGLVVAHRAGRVFQVPPLPSVHVENTRTAFFEPAEFTVLLHELRGNPSAAAVAEFMYWTGWRRNETLSREWRHVDLDRGVIVLEAGETKSGEGRSFPFDIIPELAALLTRLRAETDAAQRRTGHVIPWVFHRNGQRVKSIRQAWRTACKRAGLIGRIPHDFRRTAVRRLERAGVARSVAMKLVGHRSEAIYRRYAITNETDLREGLAKVVQQGEQSPVKGHLRHAEGS